MLGIVGFVVVGCCLAAGGGSLALIWYLNRHRGRGGAGWFMLTLGAQTTVAVAYGVGLLVFDPVLRSYLEALAWTGVAAIGPLFLIFVLEYTGRALTDRFEFVVGLLALPVGVSIVAVTHPVHGLLWREFQVVSLFGLATASYQIQPLGYLTAVTSLSLAGIGVVLLLETIISYGPLYRREALAVALSTLPPAGAFVAWLTGISPTPSLNLGVVFLLPHVALDAYAFVGTHMFETNPRTQRAAERTALDSLSEPVLVVDGDDRIVNGNESAFTLFELDRLALPQSLEAVAGINIAAIRGIDTTVLDEIDDRVYVVSYTALGPVEEDIGGVVTLYDITEERRREQQLSVLNRVMRHNLRNELTVIRGHAAHLAETLDEPHRGQLQLIIDASNDLLAIGHKAQAFDELRRRELQMTSLTGTALLEEVRRELAERDLSIAFKIEGTPEKTMFRTDPAVCRLAVANLVENAALHATADDPYVGVSINATTDGDVAITVRDQNERIPPVELTALQNPTETALEHGQGIGLRIADWSVQKLGGDLSFDYDAGNVVTIRLPDTATTTTGCEQT